MNQRERAAFNRGLEMAARCAELYADENRRMAEDGRVPRAFGDNQGAHPSRLVVTTGNPAHAAQIYNRGVHSVGGIYHTQVHVWLVSKAHAERAKAWIEEQLRAEALLNGWASAEPWHYEILFGSAAEALGFEMFDDREKMRRVLERARRAGR